MTPVDRFMAKVDKDAPNGCWLWTAALDDGGYGVFGVTSSCTRKAHRFAYENLVGPIPAGLQLDHLCRVRNCVNPDHLEPVTPRVNVLRGVGPTAKNAAKTHCIHGHPFDAKNTYTDPRGRRDCRKCIALRDPRYARRPAEVSP